MEFAMVDVYVFVRESNDGRPVGNRVVLIKYTKESLWLRLLKPIWLGSRL